MLFINLLKIKKELFQSLLDLILEEKNSKYQSWLFCKVSNLGELLKVMMMTIIIIIIMVMRSPTAQYKKYDESLSKMHEDLSNWFNNRIAQL